MVFGTFKPEGTPWVKGLAVPAETNCVSRCPRCSAVVPEQAQWCSLCYAELRPSESATVVAAEPVSAAVGQEMPVAPVATTEVGAAEVAPPTSGRHARGRLPAPPANRDDPLGHLDFELSDEQLFEILRGDQTQSTSRWSGRFTDPRWKWGVAIGGALSLILVLVIVAEVVGTFVHP